MNSILNSPDILAAIQQRKKATGLKLKASRQNIVETTNLLTGPLPKATSKAQNISRFVSNGITIYKGVRICASVLGGLLFFFGRRKRRR